MKKIFRIALTVSVLLVLTACHNHNKKEAPTAPVAVKISGSVFKGALISAKVQVYRASDIQFLNPLITNPEDVQTDGDGYYSATIVNENGESIIGALVVKFTADANTRMRCDAAVMCGDVPRGELIPTSEVIDILLTTLTAATAKADGTSNDIIANANALTTMATNAVLAQVAANTKLASAIDTLPIEDVIALQKNASVVVGKVLGVDLLETNIYDITIVDSTNTQGVADAVADAKLAGTNPGITNTLTLINSSLAAVTVTEGSTLGKTINDYVETVAVVSTTVVKAVAQGLDIATALADPATVDAQVALAKAQVEISDQATLIKDAVVADAANKGIEVDIEIVEIPVIVPEIRLDLDDIVIVTGGTGNTGS